MGKIKVNLAGGSVFEKPLVTCFQGATANYVVFDNEMNGAMGLPIICISKLVGNNVEKIFDQSEWASVKENLKSIISGQNMIYLEVPETLNGQDDFFTQLTLPVASFDVLKNAYKPPVPVMPQAPVTPTDSEVMDVPTPVAPEPVQNIMDSPVSITPSMPTANVMPSAEQMPGAQTVNSINLTNPFAENTPAEPAPQVTPTAPVQTAGSDDSELAQIKETFMKSCENMFDALVKKMQNK